MEDQDVEDDGYSDDDLDALPVNAFRELQENAIRSTQQHALLPPQSRSWTSTSKIHVDDERATSQGNMLADTMVANAAPPEDLLPASSDYGDIDDEMLDGEIFDAADPSAPIPKMDIDSQGLGIGEVTQREQWRQQRYGAPPLHSLRSPLPPTLINQQNTVAQLPRRDRRPAGNSTPPDKVLSDPQSRHSSRKALSGQGDRDINELQDQVQALLHEREQLQQAFQGANEIALAKAGEIAIVRANASKMEREHINKLEAVQKSYIDEYSRQKIEVEKARAELQKVSTEKDFLENDLAQGTKQIRNLQTAMKKGGEKAHTVNYVGTEHALTTPKRSKVLPCGDGFDIEEIQPLSPSGLVLRSKPNTPKAGAKRKRKATEDSPTRPLDLAQPVVTDPSPKQAEVVTNLSSGTTIRTVRQYDRRFEFMQRLLNHRIQDDASRSFEALIQYRLPSQPDQTLSTILLDQMSPTEIQPSVENLPPTLALIVISTWSQCIKEKYYEPVHLLLDLVKHILVHDPLKTAPELINCLMSVLQETADIIIIPRCQKKPPRTDRAEISSTECLSVLCLMASDCSIDETETTRFWRTMRFDFVMMLLSFIHPLEELHMTISLLRTSVLGSSFAMIVPPGDGKQDTSEARVLDNLSRLLVEAPRANMGETQLDAAELSQLRLEIVSLLEAICDKDYGASALARHRLVIGRLVRVMNDELDRAYDYRYGHDTRIALVNASTRLLFYLISNCSPLIDMQARLSVIPGGEKKFLIVLTRLAFSEGGFLEKGIENDVVDCAHQMLEARISPEEAEQLVDAFSSASGTKASSRAGYDTSRDGS